MEENPLESVETAIAFSPHDWSSHHRMAWIYGITCGWDDEALVEMMQQHGWTGEAVSRLKRLHIKWKKLHKLVDNE